MWNNAYNANHWWSQTPRNRCVSIFCFQWYHILSYSTARMHGPNPSWYFKIFGNCELLAKQQIPEANCHTHSPANDDWNFSRQPWSTDQLSASPSRNGSATQARSDHFTADELHSLPPPSFPPPNQNFTPTSEGMWYVLRKLERRALGMLKKCMLTTNNVMANPSVACVYSHFSLLGEGLDRQGINLVIVSKNMRPINLKNAIMNCKLLILPK